ncbi:MAG: hypothetical protein SFZ03_10635 [Candidatus Melainabacteria bacterium]|nr:hypothetical protein [Candidatus Melainabacteria bacterium]
MAKAINWPLPFRDEILKEDCLTERIALRLGTLYFDHQFWVPGEVVDIRVNHLKVRKAIVVQPVRKTTPAQLTPEDFKRLKTGLTDTEAVVHYLRKNYNQPVDEQTPLSVVAYKNLPVVPDEIEVADDPHL